VEASSTPTGPQRSITLIELYDGLMARLDENDRRSALRDKLIVDELEQIKATQARHESRIGVLEQGSPAALSRPLWMVALLIAALIAVEVWRVR
jgi:hypothetical protein